MCCYPNQIRVHYEENRIFWEYYKESERKEGSSDV